MSICVIALGLTLSSPLYSCTVTVVGNVAQAVPERRVAAHENSTIARANCLPMKLVSSETNAGPAGLMADFVILLSVVVDKFRAEMQEMQEMQLTASVRWLFLDNPVSRVVEDMACRSTRQR